MGRLTRYMNACTSQIIQQVLLLHIQPEQDMRKDDNALNNFVPYEDKESTLEAQDLEKDHKDSVGKSSDTRSYANAGRIP